MHWSMSELGDYIYVGTGRNILVNIIGAITPQAQLPALIKPDPIVNQAEIWRYKKDGSLPWERVYTAPPGTMGFRFMINHRPFGGSPCLYAATVGQKVQVLKSTNGVNWYALPDTVLQGTSSRTMISHRGKLYLSTVQELVQNAALLYSSPDPEFYPWENLIDPSAPGFDPAKNPTGPIWNMAVLNNRIYVGVSSPDGVQVWRTNGPEPKMNDWKLIVDKGFGNPDNVYVLAMGVFKDHVYVSGTKDLPLSWAIPRGCDLIRINKNDEWELIVGGNPFLPGPKGASGLASGFNNPFNVYAWQIQEYKGKLLVSTFDDSSNMEVILTTLLANKAALEQRIGATATNVLIGIYKGVVEILRVIEYPVGFDLYESKDGVHFNSVFLNGLGNRNNYGGRILYVDKCKKLYIGTANPFNGCEVWRACSGGKWQTKPCDGNHYKNLEVIWQTVTEKFDILNANMPTVLNLMQKDQAKANNKALWAAGYKCHI